jgi:hypothetical protein
VTALALQTVANMTTPAASLSRLSLLLSLLVFVPRVGLAAGESPAPAQDVPSREASPPESSQPPLDTARPSSPQLAPAQNPWAWQPRRPDRGTRILAETGAGLLTGAGGALAGTLTGGALCWMSLVQSGADGANPCVRSLLGGLMVGTGLGFSLGTFWGGEAAGGNGHLLGALGGMAGGALVGYLGGAAAYQSFGGGLVWCLPGALIGSILGYELTDQGPKGVHRAPAVALSRPRVQPLLAVSSRGALLGLGGAF